MILGLTGSFGSGKTTISELFKQHGFKIINVDKLYHNIYKNNKTLQKKIFKEFKTTDREKLKEIVFNNKNKLKKLNNLTHPYIFKELDNKIKQIQKKNKKTKILVDIPLLFESKSEKRFDKIIVIKTTKKTQMDRILKKTKKYTKTEIDQIIKSQMPLKDKLKKADFVIDNNGTLNQIKQVQIVANVVNAISN